MKKYQDSRALKQFKQDLQQEMWDATTEEGDTVEITFEFFTLIFEYPLTESDLLDTDIF